MNIWYDVRSIEFTMCFKQQEVFLKFITEAVKANTKNCLHFTVEAVNDINTYNIKFTFYTKEHEDLVRDLADKYSKEYN